MKKYSRKHIGKEFTTKESLGGYRGIVVDGGSKTNYCTIQINNWIAEVTVGNLKKGVIKYPFHPAVFGVGFVGEGKYSHKTHKDIYGIWHNMLERCYDPRYHEKRPTYIGTTICKEWLNFQTFARWCERYYPKDGSKYHLDKDLLSDESKVYSPQTCLFVPPSLNTFMTNTNSNNKSGHIGVSWGKSNGKWIACITINGKNKTLGSFTDVEEANIAYKLARVEQVKRWRVYYSFDYPRYVLDRLK